MSETSELIIGICVLILVITLSRKFHAWKIKRAYIFIIEDLKTQGAFDPASAVDLSYARNAMFRIGYKDHRPTALKHLISNNIVGITTDENYYLKDKTMNLSQN
jgi:hypothetical protein